MTLCKIFIKIIDKEHHCVLINFDIFKFQSQSFILKKNHLRARSFHLQIFAKNFFIRKEWNYQEFSNIIIVGWLIVVIYKNISQNMIEDCKQNKIRFDQLTAKQAREQVGSEYLQSYKDLMGSFNAEKDIEVILSRHKIRYDPQSPFEAFSFEVEQLVPVPDYLKVHIKMAHFALSITAIRHYDQKRSVDSDQCPVSLGKVCFTKFKEGYICFKNFFFESEQQFQAQFQRAVKEFTILKICSALQCGPYLENYAGFDIIIYDDCIQYAAEKGQPIQRFTRTDQQNLQQQLTLLHSLKIIHYDIKPDNIVFCHTYDKPVFIDFGFSQIIKQPLGLKTFGSFRGTPNYCAPQILDLMMKDDGYADLYYNDAVCLSTSVIQMQNYGNQEMSEDSNSQNAANIQPELFLFLFKYHYLHRKIPESQESLQIYLQEGGNIQNIFLFAKQVFRYIFLLPKMEKLPSHYKDDSLYKEIMQGHKFFKEKIFLHITSDEDIGALQDNKSFIPQSFLSKKWTTQSLEISTGKKNYVRLFQIIMKILSFEERTIWHYISLVFSCVRFDVRNLSVEQKDLIAKKINPLLAGFRGKQYLNVHQQTQRSSDLEQTKLLLRSILQFCLEQRANSWSKENLIDILQQLILLDVDLSEYVDCFLKFFQKQAQGPLQSILFVLQCYRLISAIALVYSGTMEPVGIVHRKINDYMQQNEAKFIKQASTCNDQSIVAICKFLQVFEIEDDILCSFCWSIVADSQDVLIHINHSRIRKSLLYLMVTKDIRNWDNIAQNQFAINKILQLNRCWQSRKIHFFCWLETTIKLMNIASSEAELKVLFKEVGKIINCDKIMNNILHYDRISKEPNQTLFNQKINKLLKSYSKIGNMNKRSNFVLHQITEQIANQEYFIDQKLSRQLNRLYRSYEKCTMKYIAQQKESQVQFEPTYCEIFRNAEIQAFFYTFSSQTQGMLMFKLRQAQKNVKMLQNSQDKNILYFQLYLYEFLFNSLKNKLQLCINSLSLFVSHCKKLNLKRLTLQGLKRIKRLACQSKILTLIISSTKDLYNYCNQTDYLFFYLLPCHANQTFTTLAVFAEDNHHAFYQLINNLLQLIYYNPIDSYIVTFIAAIDQFLQKDPQHGYLVHVNRLNVYFVQILLNPYFLIFYMYSLGKEDDSLNQLKILKIISAHVDKLSAAAKGKILEKYFIVHLRFLRDKKFQQYLFNFRRAKMYLKEERTIFEIKRIFRSSKRSKHTEDINAIMKKKLERFINNIK